MSRPWLNTGAFFPPYSSSHNFCLFFLLLLLLFKRQSGSNIWPRLSSICPAHGQHHPFSCLSPSKNKDALMEAHEWSDRHQSSHDASASVFLFLILLFMFVVTKNSRNLLSLSFLCCHMICLWWTTAKNHIHTPGQDLTTLYLLQSTFQEDLVITGNWVSASIWFVLSGI